MLLRRLSEYADRLSLPPPLYSDVAVRYIVELGRDGALTGMTDTADPASPRTRRGLRRPAPSVQRSSMIRPLLFADTAEYTFGLPRAEGKPRDARTARCHEAYVELVDRCAGETGEREVVAVARFLTDAPLKKLSLPSDFDRGAFLTFRVEGGFVVDLPSVQRFWANEQAAGDNAPRMQCVVCGNTRPVLSRLQAKIKGIPGGQTAGTALISANADAFESYGLEASLVAPTCSECGERFTKAANQLLRDESSRLRLGDTVTIFWTREPTTFSLREFLERPSPDQVRALLGSVRTGRRADADDSAFYATVLSASGGRAVVRDWIDSTLGEVRQHVARWFERQAIVDAWGAPPRPLGLYALAAATVRDARNDLKAGVTERLLRSALSATPLPYDLAHRAVRRCVADGTVSHQQAALIKLVLASNSVDGEDPMTTQLVQLDPENPSDGYRCGRLFAVLEAIQRLAVPGAKSTIIDRFYGSASSAPASVFARLMRGAQPHLAKLQRDKPGAYRALETRLEDIQAGLKTFPTALSLQDQGLFALGYYHQRAFDRAQAKAAAERRRGRSEPKGDEELADADEGNGEEV